MAPKLFSNLHTFRNSTFSFFEKNFVFMGAEGPAQESAGKKPNGLEQAKLDAKKPHARRMAEMAAQVEAEWQKGQEEEAQRARDRAAHAAEQAEIQAKHDAAQRQAEAHRDEVADKKASAKVEKGNKGPGSGVAEDAPSSPDYDLVAKTALDEAAIKGQKLTDRKKAQLVLDAKLDANARYSERKLLTETLYKGMTAHTANDNMKIGDFLNYPAVAQDLGVKSLDAIHLEGIFPGIENQMMAKGDHLMISKDKKSIIVVRTAKDFALGEIDKSRVTEVAKGTRSEEAYEQMIAKRDAPTEKEYTLDTKGRVKFASKDALRDTTLGDMFKEAALVVNGKLVMRGEDGEYHAVDKKGKLASAKVLVLNGTRVSKDIPDDQKKRYAAATGRSIDD